MIKNNKIEKDFNISTHDVTKYSILSMQGKIDDKYIIFRLLMPRY